ncbi:preprotein translocase subunit YajC [Peptacetobacter sp. AB845]|uniref:preprotein translocase subunit YajC n=1 Tax=Peptacetobacter sp. AB845 TaxID=3388429 RepID=UPI0039C9C96C
MPTQQLIMSLVLWVVVFAVFYFLLIRPQKKKDKELKQMRDSINVGDKVVTIGGLCATVAKVEEERVVLEVGPNRTKMPFEKWAIGTVTEKKEVKHEIADPAKEEKDEK